MLLLFLLALSGTPDPNIQGYPAEQVLSAFSGVCSDTRSIKAVEKFAGKQGWERFEPARDSRLGKLLDFGKDAAAKIGVTSYEEANFRRIVAGRTLELAVTQVGGTTGCRVYDFAAQAPLEHQVVEKWAKREPSAKVEKPQAIFSTSWEPGVTGNADKTQVAFIPAGSPLSTSMHLSGLAMMAQSTGDTE